MTTGLLHTHNILRWIILVFLLVSLFQAMGKSPGIRKSSLWLLIASHITLIIGLYQYFTGSFGYKLIESNGAGEVMKNATLRFWAVEHITGMLIAIVLITIGRGRAKKLNYKAASWLFLFALIIMLASIPWPFRDGIGRPWFPGM